MKKIITLALLAIATLFAIEATAANPKKSKLRGWHSMGNIDGTEVYIDTLSIRHEGMISYATEKRVYVSPESKKAYIDKIRAEYTKMGKPKKADKWNDVSYSIFSCIYECTNKRFRVVEIEDFDSMDKRIVKTTPNKKVVRWLNVENDTLGDHTNFFICDY